MEATWPPPSVGLGLFGFCYSTSYLKPMWSVYHVLLLSVVCSLLHVKNLLMKSLQGMSNLWELEMEKNTNISSAWSSPPPTSTHCLPSWISFSHVWPVLCGSMSSCWQQRAFSWELLPHGDCVQMALKGGQPVSSSPQPCRV